MAMSLSNIKVIKRDNKGYDFGGWTHGLKILNFPNKIVPYISLFIFYLIIFFIKKKLFIKKWKKIY